MTIPHTPEELARRKARYFHDSRGKTGDPETEGYGWDDTRMLRDLEAAEHALVLAAIPLEALNMDNNNGAKWMAPSVRQHVAEAVVAIRAALKRE